MHQFLQSLFIDRVYTVYGIMFLAVASILPQTTLAQQQSFELNINCGGPNYTHSSGDVYVADQSFTNGTVFSRYVDPISGTTDDSLYQSERYDNVLAYAIPVPYNGNYQVTLHFAETFNKNQAANKRVFNMSLESTPVLTAYDIFASVGGYAADARTFQTSVNDLVLDITSTSNVNNAKLCAIQVKYNPPVCSDPNHVATVDTVSQTICSGDSVFLEGAYQTVAGFYEDTLLNINACDSIVITQLSVPVCTTPAFDFGINSGGAKYLATDGKVFNADTLFLNGLTFSNTNPNIANTSDDLLFQSERYDSDLAYEVPVPTNGFYDVSLYFSEIFNKNFAVNKRKFSMELEDSLFLIDYDIFADVGANTASIKTFRVEVLDGVLSLTSTSSINNAKLCAIRIVSAPVDCELGAWSPWSACDVSCGGGQQFRTKPVLVAAANGGLPCGDTIEYRACNTFVCPVNCVVSPWSAWSLCDADCGGGQRYRTRTVLTPSSNGGAACPALIEYEACNIQTCGNDQCPNDTIVSSEGGACGAVVNYPIDRSGIKSMSSSEAFGNVPLNLNDCPKNAYFGLSTLHLTPSTAGGTALGTDVTLENVYLKIDHKRISDLVIDLVSPNGTSVRLIERPGKSGLWGNGGCNRDDMDAYFIAGTGNSAENDCSGNKPVLSGNYTAHDGDDLADLNDGSNPNGQWTLKVFDLRNKKEPELQAWSLSFKSDLGSVINIAGLPSGAVHPVGKTTNTLVFTDSLGNTDTCSFMVTVKDVTPPVFDNCPQGVLVCIDPATWVAPTASDLCGTAVVSQISGPAQGSTLTAGTYPITYEAMDTAGNIATCTFTLTKGSLEVDAGADKTIYGGVGTGCTLLYASVQNGQAPYTYSWSNTGTSALTIACPSATTDYVVTVTDANGCSGTDTVNVEVIDISCANNKVLICYNGQTYCVNGWLAWYYTSFVGASYGGCNKSNKKIGGDMDLPTATLDAPMSDEILLDAFPNPFAGSTTIAWQFESSEDFELALYDMTGKLIRILHQGSNAGNGLESMELDASNLAPGIYLLRASSDLNSKSLRIQVQ